MREKKSNNPELNPSTNGQEEAMSELGGAPGAVTYTVESLVLRFMYQQLKHSDTQLREDVAQAMLERGIL